MLKYENHRIKLSKSTQDFIGDKVEERRLKKQLAKEKERYEKSLKQSGIQTKREEFYSSLSYILGQSIFDHELIAGNAKAAAFVRQCVNIDQIVDLLDRLYQKKHKKKLSLPSKENGRNYYRHHKFNDIAINNKIAAIPSHPMLQAAQMLSITIGSE